MTDERSPAPGEFLLYETEDGRTRVECRFVEDSLWLTQSLMADLFQVKVPTINEHLKTLYADGEIQPEATIRKFLTVRQEGACRVSRNIDHYNLDTILADGQFACPRSHTVIAGNGSDQAIPDSLEYGWGDTK